MYIHTHIHTHICLHNDKFASRNIITPNEMYKSDDYHLSCKYNLCKNCRHILQRNSNDYINYLRIQITRISRIILHFYIVLFLPLPSSTHAHLVSPPKRFYIQIHKCTRVMQVYIYLSRNVPNCFPFFLLSVSSGSYRAVQTRLSGDRLPSSSITFPDISYTHAHRHTHSHTFTMQTTEISYRPLSCIAHVLNKANPCTTQCARLALYWDYSIYSDSFSFFLSLPLPHFPPFFPFILHNDRRKIIHDSISASVSFLDVKRPFDKRNECLLTILLYICNIYINRL